MDNRNKLDFLNKYTLNKNIKVKILEYNEIDAIEDNVIPSEWKVAFRENNKTIIKNNILNIWKTYVMGEMSNTIKFLEEFLVDVELMCIGQRYSILYSVKNSRGKILYYEGRNPKDDFSNDQLKKDWNKIPTTIRNFYENVHNGFNYFPSKSMGLDPIENITYLDEYEWGILEEIGIENVELDLESSYGFFSNGMGTYVVVDCNNCDNYNATLWSANDMPDYDLNFWNVVDEWTVIGMQ